MNNKRPQSEVIKFLKTPKKGNIVKVYDDLDKFLCFGKVIKVKEVTRHRTINGEKVKTKREVAVCERLDYEPKEINYYLPQLKVELL